MKQGNSAPAKNMLCPGWENPILLKIMPLPNQPENVSAPVEAGKLLACLYWVSTFLLAAAFLAALISLARRAESGWPEAALILLAAMGTMVALARQLPTQNVLFAALIIALLGTAAHLCSTTNGIPFGSLVFGEEAGGKFFGALPWWMPVLWLVAVLNSRGVGRLILRPWRKIRAYGFWLIGLTALLTMLFDCALEPFATHTKHYWIWTTTGYSPIPQGAPISNAVGWLAVTLLILAFVTPFLINKQLSKRSVPDFHPLGMWLGGMLLFSLGAALQGLWLAVTFNLLILTVVAVFAIRGARW
jgi:uncharacterized membrane protein